MRTIQRIRKQAPRLLLTLTVFLALSLSMFAPIVSADTTPYTAAQIHDWLVDQVSTATVEITDATTVYLDSTDNYMRVDGLSLNVMGVSIGLSPIKFTFNGTTDVLILAELDLFGISPKPRIECTATVACIGPNGPLEITGIDAVKVGSFVPTLSSDDLAAIVDVLNQIIAASGLTVSPPSATLTGISVVDSGGDKVQLAWSGGDPTYLEATDMLAKINGMVGTLETKATNYLQAGEGDWNIEVEVVSGTSLNVSASLTAFGITATLNVPIAFSTLTATVTEGTFSIGDQAPKTGTFSAGALVGCSNYIPYITMQSFALGNEHPDLQDYIAGIVDTILTALDDAVDDFVAYTMLELPYYSISDIAVVGTDVVLTSAGTDSVVIDLQVGWNMVSVPVVPDDTSAEAVFPDAIAVYTWNPFTRSYDRVYAGGTLTTIEPKSSYWVAMISADTLTVAGTPVTSWDSNLSTGWNMAGSVFGVSVPVSDLSDDPPGSILTTAVYHWNPLTRTYDRVFTSIEPGKGYWLAAIADCTLSMP